jgi:hypothetical protein
MKNKDIIFAKPYEVLMYEDTDSEYIGQNENGNYILGFIVDELPQGNELHLYIIAQALNLIKYFHQQQSVFDLAKSALKLYEVKRNVVGEVIASRLLPTEELETEYNYLQEAFYLIQPPRCLPEIEITYTPMQQQNLTKKSHHQVEIKGELTNKTIYSQDANYSFAA